MIYQVASVFQQSTDEVYVEAFMETESGGVVLPDSVVISLQHETRDLNGLTRYLTVDSIEIEKEFVNASKHFVMRFKNPAQKINLWVEVSFKQGSQVTNKKAFVGVPDSPQVTMDLPDNRQFVVEIEDDYDTPTGGGYEYTPENEVVLSEEIRNSVKEYNFTDTLNIEDFEGLEYFGGGSRLLTDQNTNKFVLQETHVAPWDMKAFTFLEGEIQNLLDTTFTDWEIGPTSALVTNNTFVDTKLCDESRVWTIRARQTKQNNTDLILKTKTKVPVLPEVTYCFSNYIQIIPKNSVTKLNNLRLVINWFDVNGNQIKRDAKYIPPDQHKTLNLSSCAYLSPAGAAFASVEILLGSVDNGDDVEVKVFMPQLEVGALPTSRSVSVRRADAIQVQNINLEHFKLRMVFVPGFNHTDKAWTLVNGFMRVRFSTGTMQVAIGDVDDAFYKVLDVPFEYQAFSEVDLTVEVKSGEFLKAYRNGVFLSQVDVDEYLAGYSVVELKGDGIELNKLLVFSWS